MLSLLHGGISNDFAYLFEYTIIIIYNEVYNLSAFVNGGYRF